MAQAGTLSYNLPLILNIYRSSQFLKKVCPFDCGMCKGCIFDISINHKHKTQWN